MPPERTDDEDERVTCSFCAKAVRTDRVFTSAVYSDGPCGCICYDCVRDLYIEMIAAEMRPSRPLRHGSVGRSPSTRGQVIQLHPRRER